MNVCHFVYLDYLTIIQGTGYQSQVKMGQVWKVLATPSRSYRDRSPHDATNVGTFYAHLIIIIATCISLM